MPNIGSMLKSEISRLARREIRQEVQPIRKASAGYRREIAALKRKIASLERQAKHLSKSPASSQAATNESAGTPTRFVAKGLRSLRERLGLSAAGLARLLGVSMQSVYNWERKKTVPRRSQVAAIVALRAINKKEAHARLAQMRQPRKPAKTKRPRRTRKRG
jgi:DNA-binding transcriptional regulator YiaG